MTDLKVLNKQRWDDCKITANKGPAFKVVADKLIAPEAKARYQKVEKLTGVPYWFIAVVHQREGSQNWNTYLGNGQILNKKTTIVPKGRGPFTTWEEGAVDALTNCAPFAAHNKDWSIGGSLAMLEKYNGLGYFNKGLPSPYIWAGTNQYIKGKYTADNKYDPDAVDQQLGCAGLLKFMGVFKTAPTGSATAAGAVVSGGLLYTFWDNLSTHWVAYGLAIIGVAILVDLCYAIYNNEKNQLNVQ